MSIRSRGQCDAKPHFFDCFIQILKKNIQSYKSMLRDISFKKYQNLNTKKNVLYTSRYFLPFPSSRFAPGPDLSIFLYKHSFFLDNFIFFNPPNPFVACYGGGVVAVSRVEQVAEALLELVTDESKHNAVLKISASTGKSYQ